MALGFSTESPLSLPIIDNPSRTCISRETFQRLPFEIQWEYAMHYELPDAAHLTSEDICNALCTNNEWIPALVREDHLQLPTSRGLVVAKDVMDLVDWLVGERTNDSGDFDEHDGSLPASHYGQHPSFVQPSFKYLCTSGSSVTDQVQISNEGNVVSDWFCAMTADLENTNQLGIKARIQRTRLIARQAAADVLELEAKLAMEASYHDSVLHIITDICGKTAARAIQDKASRATEEGHLLEAQVVNRRPQRQYNANLSEGDDENTDGTHRSALSATGVSLVLCAPNILHQSSSDLQNLNKDKVHPLTVPRTFPLSLPHENNSMLKRAREDDGVSPDEAVFDRSRHRAKRTRQDSPKHEYSSAGDEIHWKDYPSENDTSSDDSIYSPSSRTDDSYPDEEAALRFKNKLVKLRQGILPSQSSDSSSGVEDDISEAGIRWADYPSDEDVSDSSFSAGSWDLEHILEITTQGRYSHDWYRYIDEYNYMEETLEHGRMSDNDLSTDDDEAYQDVTSFRPSKVRVSESIHRHSYTSPWDEPENQKRVLDPATGQMVIVDQTVARLRFQRQRNWARILAYLKNPYWAECDVNGRINDIATSDRHLDYEFDDEEWQFFEQ